MGDHKVYVPTEWEIPFNKKFPNGKGLSAWFQKKFMEELNSSNDIQELKNFISEEENRLNDSKNKIEQWQAKLKQLEEENEALKKRRQEELEREAKKEEEEEEKRNKILQLREQYRNLRKEDYKKLEGLTMDEWVERQVREQHYFEFVKKHNLLEAEANA